LTVASLAGLSIFNSVLCRRARDATILTYLMAVAYLGLSGLSWLLTLPAGWATFPSNSPVTVQDVVEGFNAGNIISVLFQMHGKMGRGSVPVDGLVPGYLARYALFHGIVAGLGALLALLRLRPIALREAGEAARSGHRGLRPVSDDRPMIWKEVFADRGSRWHWFGKLIVLLLVLASFVPVVIIGYEFFSGALERMHSYGYYPTLWQALAEQIQIWVVGVSGTSVACLLAMGVAVRAAGSISLERERQTLDSLLMTPLENKAIVFGKWLGAVLSVRWGWLWLGTLWGIGLLTGALHPLSLLLLVVTWFVYAAFLAGLGLWYSCGARSTARATTNTILAAWGLALGHWMIWLCCIPYLLRGVGTPEIVEWIAGYQAGLTPPLNLGFMSSFKLHDLHSGEPEWVAKRVGFGLLGTLTWALLTAILWGAAVNQFGSLSGRKLPSRRDGKENR
jgi:ABC-type transport system involved in multi-copper enzyme maturation permease subunit